uniref:1-deoxy-D-xylulose 5-phosphate reductoisomerase n=1 Tax=Eiseniibacteriota bacterium TaxID=2212470 RepID=A0A832I0U5_UNCEI
MSDGRRTLAVLGSTGSIGVQALEVAARAPDRLQVVALAAGRSLDALCAQARALRPRALALEHPPGPNADAELRAAAPGAEVWTGPGATARLAAACGADVVLNGVVGAAGLAASLAALGRGARLALANKETLVIGGPLVRRALAAGGELLPVDSEHSAALQCLGGRPAEEVARLVLTASGGALRDHPDWRRATRAEVLAHPVWRMGERITVDSATLFNKGLELIEAHALFDLPYARLDAVLHPQALVHAIATFTDGSSVLQAAVPDMRLPIQLALSWPARWGEAAAPLPAERLAGLEFRPIAPGRFPALDLALAAGRAGGTAPCVLNAADEVAVRAFLDGAVPLGAVPDLIARALDAEPPQPVESLAQLEAVDARARAVVRAAVARA